MTLVVDLEPEVESLLEERAKADGCDVKAYVRKLIERAVRSARTIDEILEPFRDAVERSGISDEDLDSLFAEARRQVFKEKQERLQRM
jgi:hypothetical protein